VPHFLFVGIDWGRKNGDAVLAAFGRLREVFPEATLDLVGGHPQVDLPGVRGHGRLSLADRDESARLDQLFATATCFVMPSWFEAAGIVYLEAAAAGLPSVGTTRGGASDLVGGGGRVVDPADTDALTAAMFELSDPEVSRRLGAVAQSRSWAFRWDEVARRLVALLGLGDGTERPVPWVASADPRRA